jgi:ABC-2 type transport system ATP-binding protein
MNQAPAFAPRPAATLTDNGPPRAARDGEVLVRIEGLVKSFPARRPWSELFRHPFRRERVEVLRGVSLEVRAGEFFGLLGPNGAGKTTLFKVLATLILPEAGRVEVAGASAIANPRAVREVLTPVIADERSLYWRLTGLENLLLFAALYGIPGAQRERTARQLLEAVALQDAAGRMVGTYSSGMKQRMLIARALLSRPAVLLLDEPTRSLDPVTARDFRRFLREEIVGRQGCTVLLATHDADEAFELCDRLAVLDRGRLVADGTAAELARLAGENRYRMLVANAEVDAALAVVRSCGLDFQAGPASEPGWSPIEGEVPRGAATSAELTRRLAVEGVAVAEVSRVPLSLADLIERLVEKGRSG